MKSKLALATVMFSLASSGFAATQQETVVCPDINELKAGHFASANAVYDTNLWAVAQTASKYGTKNPWNFTVNIEADDQAGAMQQATAMLGEMHLISGPEKVDNDWMCHYRSGQHDAVAIMSLPKLPTETKAVAKAKAHKAVVKADKLASK